MIFELGLFIGYFLILTCIILGLTLVGSRFSRVFLQKIAIVHAILLVIVLSIIYMFRQGGDIIPSITPAIALLLLTPFLEEGAKHL